MDDSGKQSLSLDYPDSGDIVFLDAKSKKNYKKLCQLIRGNNMGVAKGLSGRKVYLPLANEALMRKHSLGNTPHLAIKQVASVNAAWREWDDKTYHQWKRLPVSENLSIFTCRGSIANKFCLTENDVCFLEIPLDGNENYGVIADNKGKIEKIAVRFPNGEDENMYKALEQQVVPNVEEFQVPFIALQGMKLKELMEKPEIDSEKAEIAQKIPLEDLLKMNDGRHRLVEDDGEEEKDTKVNNITGFLGECLFRGYAERKHHGVEWSSQEGEGSYDFLLDGETMVDVKTNVLTLKDGKAPFYLHSSQMHFLRSNNPKKYYICRLSLTDLGIEEDYKKLRKEFGIEADPSENDLLRRKCEEIAERYWNGNDTELFTSNIRVYWIRDVFNGND